MKPKLSDIAHNLSVSSATVSLALSGKGRLSAKTVERIEVEARRIGYAPNQMGKALRTGRSHVIGLVLPDVANPLFPRMARAIVLAAEDLGYGVLIADSHSSAETQKHSLQRLIDLGSDGIIVIPQKGTEIVDCSIPVAVIDAPTSRLNVVSADHAAGGAIAISHLQEQGHLRILCVGGTRSSLVQRTRMSGMMNAASPAAKLTEHWVDDAPDIVSLIAAGATAIATTSDMIAVQFLTELGSAGLRVPQDVSLVGFDDLDIAKLIHPKLTSIATSEIDIGQRAIAGLIQLINGGTRAKNEVIPMRLVRRDTVAKNTSGGDHL